MTSDVGFSVFYSRPPLFMEIHAPTPEQLRKKVHEIDARLAALTGDKNDHQNPVYQRQHRG